MSQLLIFLLLIIFAVVFAVFLFRYLYWNDITQSKYYPFANLPEISISEQPKFIANHLLSILTNQPGVDADQNMLNGSYKRYPLGKKMQPTSIVAVDAALNNFPYFTSWAIEVDVDAWNFVWDDSGSSYFVTTVNLLATPIVCIKGEFPRARYMSIYSYVGPDQTKSGDKLFGQAPTANSEKRCNASLKSGDDACAGLRDYEIEPDEGSVNPFRSPCLDTDDKFYTIYLKSPYYDGPLPKSKNIIPLSIYGAKTAIILYRLYSSFNPKDCSSKYYWSNIAFDTRGCSKDGKYVPTNDGGTVNRQLDKTDKTCKMGDSVCYNQCIADRLGHSKVEACHEFLGNNLYCICDNKTNPCYKEIDDIVKYCTNGHGDVDNFCAKRPLSYFNSCIDKIDCSIESPDYTQSDCQFYKDTAKYQQCVGKKLLESENPDCYVYKDPNKICNICSSTGSCKTDFQNFLKDCGTETGYKPYSIDQYCKFQCPPGFPGTSEPPYPYNPDYDFNIPPLVDCQSECLGTFDCVNGYCVESKNGSFTSPNCDNKCPLQLGSPTRVPRRRIREYYSSSPTVKPCAFNPNSPEKCDYSSTNSRWKDIGLYGINSTPASKLFRQGWVDLPQVFFKYSYSNYFIRLTNWNLQKNAKLSLYHAIEPVISNLRGKEPVQPNNVYENFSIDDVDKIIDACSKEDLASCLSVVDDVRQDRGGGGQRKQKRDEQCDKWLNENTYYFDIGTQFPVGKGGIHQKTYKSSPPNCNYWLDLCRCKNNQTNANNCCNVTLGNVDCEGNPCFTRWDSFNNKFIGDAKAFVFSGDTGGVIPFPNPDASYIGCCTNFDSDSVYIIWMDIPTFPITPGYDNIIRQNYDVRYFSIGHYFWNMSAINPRPVLSDLTDAQLKSVPVEYTDEYTNQTIKANRVCIVLATIEQYEYIKTYNLWDDNVNWLNWGKVVNMQLKDGEGDSGLPPDILPKNKTSTDSSLLTTPKQGILLYRQLFPSQDFPEAISNFTSSNCITDSTIIQDKYEKSNFLKGTEYPRYCNPGPGLVSKFDTKYDKTTETPVCTAYGFDPCCLARDVLYSTKNYYPRCEKIRICDIEAEGKDFWYKYLFYSLPYKYDETPIPPPPKPTHKPYTKKPYTRKPYTRKPIKEGFSANHQTEFLNKLLQHIHKVANQLFKKAGKRHMDHYSLNPTIEQFTKDLFTKHTVSPQAISSFNLPLDYGVYRFIIKKAAEYVVLVACSNSPMIDKNMKYIESASEVTLPEKECKNWILYDSIRSDAIRNFETHLITGIRDCNVRR